MEEDFGELGEYGNLVRALVRCGDVAIGDCRRHRQRRRTTGILVTGSNNVLTNDRCTGRECDIFQYDCGHIGIVVCNSRLTYINNRGAARVLDNTINDVNGIIISGSPDTATA